MSFAAVVIGALRVNKSFSGVYTDNQVVQRKSLPTPKSYDYFISR